MRRTSGRDAAERLEIRTASVSPLQNRCIASIPQNRTAWNSREAQPLYSTPDCE